MEAAESLLRRLWIFGGLELFDCAPGPLEELLAFGWVEWDRRSGLIRLTDAGRAWVDEELSG